MTEQSQEPQALPIPRAFVQRVTTNLKTPGEKPRDFALGPLTLLVGPSGSGKTSLIDAICLALVGSSPTRGLGKLPANLKRALPGAAHALTASVELSVGESIMWSLGRDDSHPVWSAKDGFVLSSGALLPVAGTVISVADALDLLLGYDKPRMLAILAAIPDTRIKVAGLDAAVAGMDRELAVRLEGVLPKDGDLILPEHLRQALSTADALASEFSKAVSACETFKTTGLSGAEQVELESLEKTLAAQAGAAFLRNELSRAEKQLDAAQRESVGMRKLIEADVPGFFSGRDVATRASELLGSTVSRMATRGAQSARCPGCGEEYPLGIFASRREKLDAKVAESEKLVEGYLEQWRYQEEGLTALSARYAVLSDLLTEAGASGTVDEARLAELRHRKSESSLSLAAGVRVSSLKRFQKAVAAIQDALLDSAAKAVPAAATAVRLRVNRVLPKGRTVEIVCEERKVRIGQTLNKGQVVPAGALSGSERVVLAAALALGLQPARTSPVSLLVIDETMFDRATLKHVLTGLGKAFDNDAGPTQIVVCASEWQKSIKLPAGWIKVEMSEEAVEGEEKSGSANGANAAGAGAPPLDIPGVEAAGPQEARETGENQAESASSDAALPPGFDDLL